MSDGIPGGHEECLAHVRGAGFCGPAAESRVALWLCDAVALVMAAAFGPLQT